jgi:hypothetical protein
MELVLQCTGCHLVKPTSEYSIDRGNQRGFKAQCKKCLSAKDRERRLHRLRTGGYVATNPAEREKQAEIARLCGAMREWGYITHKGQLRPMVRVELEEAA